MEDSVTLAWKQYEKDHNGQAFFDAVSKGVYLGFRLPYYKAAVYHEMGRDKEAAIQITNAIRNFKVGKCGDCKLRCGDPIYFLAEKIFTKIGDKASLAKCNALSAKYNCIPSDFEGKDYIFVYSFRTYNQYSAQDLINNEITVVAPSELNDPFDSVFNLFRSIDNLKQLCTSEEDASIVNNRFNYFRIRSFCIEEKQNPVKDILMWSHYANAHKGFCVKYRLSKRFINSTNQNGYLCMKRIRYKSAPVSVFKQQIEDDLAFATKNIRWKYENEVRLISYDISTDSHFSSHPLDDNSCIDSIYFGYRCEDKTKKTIYNIVSQNYPKCRFKEMSIDSKKNIYNLLINNYHQ